MRSPRSVRAFTILLLLVLFAGLGTWAGFTLARRGADEAREGVEVQELDREPVYRRTAMVPDASVEGALEERDLEEVRGELRAARWTELNRRAIRALEVRDFTTAVALFEQCVRGVPDEATFARNLAEALARRAVEGRKRERPCVQCLADLERALELAPERGDLAALLARWREEAAIEADFWRDQSLHFDLSFDGSRDDVLDGSHRLLQELEDAYGEFVNLFGHAPVERGRPRIQVVLYRREGFDRVTGLGDWAGGAFDGTVRIPVEDLARQERGLRSVLRHELVHAFVLEVGGGGVPGWLNEGLAQWLELDRAAGLARARSTLGEGKAFTLEELGGSLASWQDAGDIERAYAQSLLFVDHLAQHYGERVVFALVSGCLEDVAPATTFRRLTSVPLETALGDMLDAL